MSVNGSMRAARRFPLRGQQDAPPQSRKQPPTRTLSAKPPERTITSIREDAVDRRVSLDNVIHREA
jgi:hypothetical protein